MARSEGLEEAGADAAGGGLSTRALGNVPPQPNRPAIALAGLAATLAFEYTACFMRGLHHVVPIPPIVRHCAAVPLLRDAQETCAVAMTKAEMEHHHAQYHAHMASAREAQQRGLYRQAVEIAFRSWAHIDGMMQFERKYDSKDFASVTAIDLVLKYAPLLLDPVWLDKLDELLKDSRRIEKNTSESLADNLADARRRLSDAHRLWDHLEWNAEVRQDDLRKVFGGDQNEWRELAESWEKMGIVERAPEGGSYRVRLRTRMGGVCSGKCPACGGIAQAPKAMFLEPLTCTDCGGQQVFVILATDSGQSKEI